MMVGMQKYGASQCSRPEVSAASALTESRIAQSSDGLDHVSDGISRGQHLVEGVSAHSLRAWVRHLLRMLTPAKSLQRDGSGLGSQCRGHAGNSLQPGYITPRSVDLAPASVSFAASAGPMEDRAPSAA